MKSSLLGISSVLHAILISMACADEPYFPREASYLTLPSTSTAWLSHLSKSQSDVGQEGVIKSAVEPSFGIVPRAYHSEDTASKTADSSVTEASEVIFPVSEVAYAQPAAQQFETETIQADSSNDASKRSISQLLDVQAMIGPMSDATTTLSRLGLKDDQSFASQMIPDSLRGNAHAFCWGPTAYTWASPVFYHRPLYFEQPNLERYGNGPLRIVQPAASAAHFFFSVPLVPAKMLHNPPWADIYTLGEGRPGNLVRMQSRYDVMFEE